MNDENKMKNRKNPDPDTVHPIAGEEKEIQGKPTGKNPNLIVGDFTYIADSVLRTLSKLSCSGLISHKDTRRPMRVNMVGGYALMCVVQQEMCRVLRTYHRHIILGCMLYNFEKFRLKGA